MVLEAYKFRSQFERPSNFRVQSSLKLFVDLTQQRLDPSTAQLTVQAKWCPVGAVRRARNVNNNIARLGLYYIKLFCDRVKLF